MSDNSDDLAVSDHFLEVTLNGLASQIVGPFFGRLSKGLLLALVPASKKIGLQD